MPLRSLTVAFSLLENNDMDKDRIAGAANDAAGKAESAFGQATGNAARDASGRAHTGRWQC